MKRLMIAVLEDVPDFMVPTLVAHSVISAHLKFEGLTEYKDWLHNSFRKVVLRVNRKEFNKIEALDLPKHLGHENKTLDGLPSCIVVIPLSQDETPSVLKFARLWKPVVVDV